MPRDGSFTLSDVREPTLAIVCEPCGRRGRLSVARLMAQHGDAKLTYLGSPHSLGRDMAQGGDGTTDKVGDSEAGDQRGLG